MTWSSKRALTKAAAKIAEKKHPDGYNKKQLIEASHKVNGGFSTNPLKPIKTMEDVNNMGNHMSEIDGHYPRGMSTCYIVGLNGGCGFSCPAFLDGSCDNISEFSLEDFKASEEHSKDVEELYEWEK